MRHFSRSAIGFAALLAGTLALLAGRFSPAGGEHQHGNAAADSSGKSSAATKARPAPGGAKNSCAACIERAPILDPARYALWNDQDVRRAYEAAQKYPNTLDRIHCFCECKESPREHHKTLLTCFTTEHGAGCGICQHEANLAAKLKDKGASDEEVEMTVESLHKTEGHPPTKGRGV
jgi:hypothetical protein